MLGIIGYCLLCCFITSISGQSCQQNNPFPANWVVILDTYRYEFLIPQRWPTLDLDGNFNNYYDFGGVCSRGGYICRSGNNENNWVFSEHLQYGSANEVFFNLSYDLSFCVGNCNPYFTLYTFYKNSTAGKTERTDPSNYHYLTGSETTSRFGDTTSYGSFHVERVERPSNFTGFYLAIRDTGTCGEFRRVLAYYKECPARVSGLVSFPRTSAPARSSGNSVYSGSCAPNSHAVTSLEVEINSDTGNCTERAPGGARCECNSGYYLYNATTCAACSPGQYRASNEPHDSCNPCPQFTIGNEPAASICPCQQGYYRSMEPGEGAEVKCSKSPGPVGNLRVTFKNSTSVEIRWKRPNETGGRSDYYYSIERSDPGSSTFSKIVVANSIKDHAMIVSYTIDNLLPFETYEIFVITHNGVSNQEMHTVMLRTSRVVVKTEQALPGTPVSVTYLCTAVVWKPPENPNGIITGYDVEVENVTKRVPAKKQFFVTTSTQQQNNALVRVRAINEAGPGKWSQLMPICSDTTTFCPETPSCQVCPECPPLTTCPTERGDLTSTTEATTEEKVEVTSEEKIEGTTEEKIDTTEDQVEVTAEKTVPSSVAGFYFRLGNKKYENNSTVFMEDIGEGDEALLCVSENNSECCDKKGQFYYPNCSYVPIKKQGKTFYRNRGREEGQNFIRLNRRPESGVSGEGIYKCEIPYPDNIKHKLFITIVSRDNSGSTEGEYTISSCDDVN